MKKLRADSRWQRLSQKQRDQVAAWLFDEGLGYAVVLERVHKEFGVVASMSSLKRYYYHVAPERRIAEFAPIHGTVEEHRNKAKKALALAAFSVAASHNSDKDVRTLAAVMTVVLKQREQELNQRRLAFEIAKHEMEMEKDG